jgi:enediyne biosynthesis protein E4
MHHFLHCISKCFVFSIIACIPISALGQNGWTHIEDPDNDVSRYSTIFTYAGVSFVDINNDNMVDICASPRTIFINTGDGLFTLGTPLPYIPRSGVCANSWADIDNDGDVDCLSAGVPSRVFLNDGDGIFTDVSSQLNSFDLYGSWSAAFGDLDGNRNLDFIFTSAEGFHAPAESAPCRLFTQQNDEFAPTEVSGYEFLDTLWSYTCPFWSDYDLDGDMDLFISAGPANGTIDYDLCYKNMRKETGIDTLMRMTAEKFASQKQDGQCYNFIDYDNDGDLDLCLTNYFSAPTRLYKNNNGAYVSVPTAFTTTTTSLANCWGDYDNDGDLDVIVSNDNQPATYYSNDGDGAFTFHSDGFTTPTGICSIANGDYDNDGDLDIFANGLGNNGKVESLGLYRNDMAAPEHAWVNLTLIGTASNRSAVGSVIDIRARINGKQVRQLREINTQNTFQGQNDLRVHFGLGTASIIDTLFIRWQSGAIDTIYSLPVKGFYRITEGGQITTLSVRTPYETTHAIIVPQPSMDNVIIRIPGCEDGVKVQYTITNVHGHIIHNGVAYSNELHVSVTNFPSGTYLADIRYENEKVSVKFIKQ